MKILGSVTPVAIDAATAASLKLKDNFSFLALPGEILEKYQANTFDIIEDDNKIMLVARNTEQTSESNKPTTKEVLSNV